MVQIPSLSGDLCPKTIERRLSELLDRVSNNTTAMRMWRDLMTKEDREKLRDMVNAAPVDPEIDDVDYPDAPPEEVEVLEGSPGRLLHRCYYRWRADGMWMRAREVAQPRAIVELAVEHGFVTEAEYRRLLRDIGETETRTRQSKLPEWDREGGQLRLDGTTIRTVRRLSVAENIVAILDAFQTEGWCSRIDAPGQLQDQTLHDAVYSLNKSLEKIKFHVSGDGAHVRWDTE
jgi:hypothetical protein